MRRSTRVDHQTIASGGKLVGDASQKLCVPEQPGVLRLWIPRSGTLYSRDIFVDHLEHVHTVIPFRPALLVSARCGRLTKGVDHAWLFGMVDTGIMSQHG